MPLQDENTTAPNAYDAARSALTTWPSHVGPYRIIRPLGEGGMGVVYLAEQESPVRREVAVKVLRSGLDSAEILARFESERRALALMEHPNITRVYEAGTTDAGTPYFVMERVRGVPITEFADAKQLAVRERLRLAMQVCSAVQHAHLKGVIHRDIKPSNVLVTEEDGAPTCKVIDFGIAKATDPGPDAARLTATGLAIGTPAYMSPEQLSVGAGGDVDTRTDVYSLGVLLYELLTGVLPVELDKGVGWLAVTKMLGTDAPPPSVRYAALGPDERARIARLRASDTRALRRALAGDIDAVLLKALEHDRERRYGSASDLARDLAHHLHDEPVMATAPSHTYRLRKFVRRHRGGVLSASASLAMLVAFAVNAAVQARRLARAERVAVARQAQAEELIGFMIDDLRGRLAPLGKLDLLGAVGERALAYFAAVPESELSDGERYRRAQALYQLGQVRIRQNRLDDAKALLARSLALAERLAARDSTNAAWQIALGRAHFWAGNVALSQGRLDSAAAHFEPFVRVSERLVARFPDSVSFRREMAGALSSLGSAREQKGDFAGALRYYRRALTLDSVAARRDTGAVRELALSYNTLGVAQRKTGDLAGAIASHRAELALWERLAPFDTSDRDMRRSLANAHSLLSLAHLARGDRDSALAQARAGRDLFAALVARDSANAVWRTDLAVMEGNVALDLVLADTPRAAADAVPHVDAALALLEPLARAPSPTARVVRTLAGARTTRARTLLATGRTRDALLAARDAVTSSEQSLAKRRADLEQRRVLGEAYLALGDALVAAGDTSGARAARTSARATVDSVARATGQLEFRALAANARLALGDTAGARPLVAALVASGYRHPAFVQLLRRAGVAP